MWCTYRYTFSRGIIICIRCRVHGIRVRCVCIFIYSPGGAVYTYITIYASRARNTRLRRGVWNGYVHLVDFILLFLLSLYFDLFGFKTEKILPKVSVCGPRPMGRRWYLFSSVFHRHAAHVDVLRLLIIHFILLWNNQVVPLRWKYSDSLRLQKKPWKYRYQQSILLSTFIHLSRIFCSL